MLKIGRLIKNIKYQIVTIVDNSINGNSTTDCPIQPKITATHINKTKLIK